MGTITLNTKSLDNFFGFLFKMDINSKKKLIIKLTESIEIPKRDNSDLKSLYGAWVDNRDSDSIIKEIKDSRFNNRDIIEF